MMTQRQNCKPSYAHEKWWIRWVQHSFMCFSFLHREQSSEPLHILHQQFIRCSKARLPYQLPLCCRKNSLLVSRKYTSVSKFPLFQNTAKDRTMMSRSRLTEAVSIFPKDDSFKASVGKQNHDFLYCKLLSDFQNECLVEAKSKNNFDFTEGKSKAVRVAPTWTGGNIWPNVSNDSKPCSVRQPGTPSALYRNQVGPN